MRIISCPLCLINFNSETQFKIHCSNIHDVVDLRQFYIDTMFDGIDQLCACGCKEQLKFKCWRDGFTTKFIRGHMWKIPWNKGLTKETDERLLESGKKISATNSENSLPPWNKGLTKETDERIKKLAWCEGLTKETDERIKKSSETRSENYKSGKTKKREAWCKGLTKETDERVKKLAWSEGLTKETDERVKKSSDVRIENYKSGKSVAWSKGLTKETDERLLKTSETHIENCRSGKTIPWCKGLTKETDERVAKISKTLFEIYANNVRKSTKFTNQEIIEYLNSMGFDISEDFFYKNIYSKLLIKCNVCGNESLKHFQTLQHTPKCFVCNPSESIGQLEVFEYIKSILPKNIEVELSNRTVLQGKELDIYVPCLNFAVEYNGLYWHSELFNSDLNYHENKTIQCNQSNVNLLHIYEDEWKTKQIIVKSLIKNLLGLTEKFNQKFEIVELSLEESKLFFEDNHLDGNSESDITFGLSHNNEIISAISLNSVEYSNRKYLKIERFTNKLNFDIPNSLNELTKYVLEYSKMNNYNGLLAYVDNRICNNEIIYEKSNYKFLEKTELPQLWLTNFKNRFEISQKQTLEKNESYIWGHRKSIMILDC